MNIISWINTYIVDWHGSLSLSWGMVAGLVGMKITRFVYGRKAK